MLKQKNKKEDYLNIKKPLYPQLKFIEQEMAYLQSDNQISSIQARKIAQQNWNSVENKQKEDMQQQYEEEIEQYYQEMKEYNLKYNNQQSPIENNKKINQNHENEEFRIILTNKQTVKRKPKKEILRQSIEENSLQQMLINQQQKYEKQILDLNQNIQNLQQQIQQGDQFNHQIVILFNQQLNQQNNLHVQLQNYKQDLENQKNILHQKQQQINLLKKEQLYLGQMLPIYIQKIEDQYEMERKIQIGQGGFGTVYKVLCKKTQKNIAIKVIIKQNLIQHKSRHHILNEINTLKKMDHPKIIKLYEVFEDYNMIYLVMEYCQQSVNVYQKDEMNIKIIMKQIIEAIIYCHQINICHRDIKPGNFMLKDTSNIKSVKLIDFGLCAEIEDKYFNDLYGTPSFMSPEIIKQKYTALCDIWAFGVSLYNLLTGDMPFAPINQNGEENMTENILNIKIDKKSLKKNKVSQLAISLIQQCLVSEKKRLRGHQILNHEWFVNIN